MRKASRLAAALNHLLLDVVGWKHSNLAGAFNAPRHPTAVDRVHLEDQVTFSEAHLVRVLRFVIVNRSINAHFAHRFRSWLLLLMLLLVIVVLRLRLDLLLLLLELLLLLQLFLLNLKTLLLLQVLLLLKKELLFLSR